MIPLQKPIVAEECVESVRDVFKSGWLGCGPRVKEFENEFKGYIGAKNAVAVNSCTSAMQLALNTFGVNSGEVLLPTITYVSTAHAILYNNAKPIFVDVNEDNLTMDIDDLKKKITKKAKAIMPVHYSGHPCEMDEIIEIAKEHDLKIVEDAAHACGAEYKGKKIGGFGDASCFSFDPIKNLTIGDGGMVCTPYDDIAKKIVKLRAMGTEKDLWNRSHGMKNYGWYYEVDKLGYRYHMNDISAAIGLVQLKHLDEFNKKREAIVKRYNGAFEGLGWLETLGQKEYVKSANFHYVVKVNDRGKFMEHLKEKGISSGVHYMPLYLHPLYKKFKSKCPNTDKIWEKIVTLPLFVQMTGEQISSVIDAVRNFSG